MTTEHDLPPIKRTTYTIRLDERLHSKIQRHLAVLEHAKFHRVAQQDWFITAILEKLEQEKSLTPDDFPGEKQVTLRLDERLSHEIDKIVDLASKFRTSYSKKTWVLEAITEKLAKEEQELEVQLLK